MRILKAGEPCPCCGEPIQAGLPEETMLVLSYIADGMALKSVLDEMRGIDATERVVGDADPYAEVGGERGG